MTRRLFVGNLSFEISEQELQEAFSSYGATSATIPTRWKRATTRLDQPKGFGFVEVAAGRAEEAIRGMSGKVLGGRTIDVREAKPRPELFTRGEDRGRGRRRW